MNKTLIFIALLPIMGCVQEDKVVYTMPEPAIFETYVIEHEDPHKIEQVVVSHCPEYDPFAKWQENQARKEEQDKFNMMQKVLEKPAELEAQEEELRQYCESLHSNSCLQMQTIHDRQGCREVHIECKRFNDDDICSKFDVRISEEIDEC